jgi:tetratricopeptide (TPR) repeat protein
VIPYRNIGKYIFKEILRWSDMKIVAAACFIAIVNLVAVAQCLSSKDTPLVMLRKDLVDGSKVYKDRKFKEAEQLFRDAVSCDPNSKTTEGRTARIFLARTLHSEYISNRQDTPKADEAIQEYKRALDVDPNDQFSYKAIASLLENLQKNNDWLVWVTERSRNEIIRPENRAEALVSLAARENTCANDVIDTQRLDTLRMCVNDGIVLIDQALLLEKAADVESAMKINIALATDEELKNKQEILRVFESARSYKANLLNQAIRLAKMEGRAADCNRFKNEADAAKASFFTLSDIVKAIQVELDKRSEKQTSKLKPYQVGVKGLTPCQVLIV